MMNIKTKGENMHFLGGLSVMSRQSYDSFILFLDLWL